MPGHVQPAYAHRPKQAVPRGLILVGGTELKLYHLEVPGEPVPEAINTLARAYLARESDTSLGFEGDCGFVLIHRCGADFHFLLPTVWRGNNEAWEAVCYHQSDMADFTPFRPAYSAPDGAVRPTFCVWELGIVAHEAAAWSRYLASPRAGDDLARWRDDLFAGNV